jgi:hypothetical protein
VSWGTQQRRVNFATQRHKTALFCSKRFRVLVRNIALLTGKCCIYLGILVMCRLAAIWQSRCYNIFGRDAPNHNSPYGGMGMKRATLAGIAVLGLLVLVVSAPSAKADPARAVLSMGSGSFTHTMAPFDRFTVQNDFAESRSIFEASDGCVGTRCLQHIGVFSNRIPVTDVATVPTGSTPEPGTLVLLGSGLLLMGLAVRRHA